MKLKWVFLMASVVSLGFVVTSFAGGWAAVTVRSLPEYAVAGKPLQLTFMVRGHGITPLDDLTPRVTAKLETHLVSVLAAATRKSGEYRAALTLPRPGNWAIQVDAAGSHTLPNLTAIASGDPAPPPLSQAAVGKRLFVAKGCITCHANREVGAESDGGIGPDLTGRRFPEPYLRNLLTDPKTTFKRDPEQEGWEMPNLELTKSEIAALTAFINRERR